MSSPWSSLIKLPDEIILRILKFYLETESQSDLLNCVAKIHQRWKNICLDCSLWIQYDGTVPLETMLLLADKNVFRITKECTFSPVEIIEDNQVAKIFSNLMNIEYFDFSNIEKLTPNIFEALETCPKLNKIQFQNYENYETLWNINNTEKLLNYNLLVSFLAVRGQNLLSINLSYCEVSNSAHVLRCIADCCHNLEQLYLLGISGNNVFPVKYFQEKCTNIKELYMDYKTRISNGNYPNGFQNLNVFSYYGATQSILSDRELSSILSNARNLKILNIPHCKVSFFAICSLPAENLRCLNVSKFDAYNTSLLTEVMKRWHHSLIDVNMSYCSANVLNDAVSKLVLGQPDSVLEVLNLSYTCVTHATVKKVLENCQKLRELHLEACRSLDRGMKKVYYGKKELETLAEKLKSFKPEVIIIN